MSGSSIDTAYLDAKKAGCGIVLPLMGRVNYQTSRCPENL